MNRSLLRLGGFCSVIVLVTLALPTAASAQPAFSKSFSPATIGPGSVSTLRFTITNGSSLGVRGLDFTDNLPAGVTLAAPANGTSTCGGTLTAADGGGTISFTGGSVGPSSSCSVTVDVTSSTPGTHTNVSGDLTSDAGNSGSASADLTVATNRPGFTKSFSPAAVFFGERSTLTLTIDNTANSSQAFNLSFTDNLPSGMTIASPSNAATTCTGGTLSAPAGGSVISYSTFPTTSSVAAGASCTVTVDVLGGAVGVLGNTTGELTSTSGGPSVSSGKAAATLTVTVEQISLTKSFLESQAAPGDMVTLSFTIRNLDRRSAATNISFTDDLDAALSGLVAITTPLSDPCGTGSSLTGTSLLTLSGGSLAAGTSCTFSVKLQVPSSASAGLVTNTTGAITADIDGSSVTGNPAADQLLIATAPVLTKSFVNDVVGGGGSLTLEFTITNTSSTTSLTDLAFQDVFDVILPTASATPSSGFCGAGSTATYIPLINTGGSSNPAQLLVSGASLDPGDSCTFSITLDVIVGAPAGSYTNTTSEITGTLGGESVTGNAASDDFKVVAAPVLSKEFTDDPVAPGDTVTLQFTLTHDENASGDATGITFSDDLTAALSGLTATGLPLNDVCGIGSQISGTTNLLLTDGALSPGESCTFSVTLQVPSTATAGNHTNTTSNVVATVLGETATENAASDDLAIAGLTLTKEFINDPVLPGGTVTLRFTIANTSPVSDATNIFFRDDLDDVLNNLSATGLPLSDVCGVGSSLTGLSGNTLLNFQGGSLVSGDSCTFDVTLQVPASTPDNVYGNTTSGFSATIEGSTVFFDNAFDELTVSSELLQLTKEFTDDPVAPGDTVNLRFTLTNLESSQAVTGIAFTDDLDAALSGLTALGLPIAACGGTVSGSSTISFTGGGLAAGASCSFDVTLSVPATAPLGSVVVNTTSQVTGTIGGLGVTGGAATDELRLTALTFSKAFDGDATPGGTVGLTFTIQNRSASDTASDLSFTDDLDAVLSGLTATGLPASNVCGSGSTLSGTSLLTLTGGNLLPGGSCTFTVVLQVPASALPGTYLNVTSDLLQFGGASAAEPATATLTVIEVTDSDDDGVLDDVDVCPGTVIPESVPTQRLGTNRYALVDDDFIFDTTPPHGNGPGDVFTTTDTAGCSCEQIIAALHLGQGHTKFGCSLGAMRNWVDLVNP